MPISRSSRSYSVESITESYNHLTLHLVPGPRSAKYFVPLLLIFVGLLIPRSKLDHNQLRWTFLPIIYAIQVYVWIVDASFDVISMNAMLTSFMLLGWYDVRKDFRKVHRQKLPKSGNEDERTVAQLESYPDAFTRRGLWVIDLMSAIRLTGWSSPASSRRGLPAQPWKDTISSFYLSNILKALLIYLVLDMTSSYVTTSPSFVLQTATFARIPPYLEALIFLIHLGCALALYNAFLPIAITILLAPFPWLRDNPGISPLYWPAHFGPVSAIWDVAGPGLGLRAFWSIFWHQNMRYITSTPGIALTWTLGLGKESSTRYLVIVSTSFFFSGVVHMGVIPSEPLKTPTSCWQLRIRLAAFFWLQPLGIAFELHMARLLLEAQRRRKWLLQVMIVAWTLLYLLITAWWTIRPVGREMRWWSIYLVPIPVFSHRILL